MLIDQDTIHFVDVCLLLETNINLPDDLTIFKSSFSLDRKTFLMLRN